MFRGINGIKIDDKGRMKIPSRYKEALSSEGTNGIVITIDTETPSLLMYPSSVWEDIEQQLEALPSFDRAARRIQRLLIGHATDLELDANGRVLIPPLLREYAALERDVMLVGQGKKFEIWSDVNWQQGRAEWLASANPDLGDGLSDELRSISL